MNNVLIAKQTVKNLIARVEKELYILKYKDYDYVELTPIFYEQLRLLCDTPTCNKLGLKFPLKRIGDNIFLDGSNEDLFSVLHILANEYNIILNYNKLS